MRTRWPENLVGRNKERSMRKIKERGETRSIRAPIVSFLRKTPVATF